MIFNVEKDLMIKSEIKMIDFRKNHNFGWKTTLNQKNKHLVEENTHYNTGHKK